MREVWDGMKRRSQGVKIRAERKRKGAGNRECNVGRKGENRKTGNGERKRKREEDIGRKRGR